MRERAITRSSRERRTRTGHGFWPHEVLRDSILLSFMAAVLLFYAWLIPPPLHSAADPYAQAGFVFPDWYVLFYTDTSVGVNIFRNLSQQDSR